MSVRRALAAVLPLTLLGCGGTPTTTPLDFGGGPISRLQGLAACSPEQPAVRPIDPDQPLVVLVHGCYSSGGRFRALADVFELHGQQTLCFNYDDRASLRESGRQLRTALRGLRRYVRNDSLTVVGHSQGGLVARVALSTEEPGAGEEPEFDIRLVTVSSPFAGIQAASDCGSIALHVASLGLTVAACQMATGSDWNEIHPRADLVLDPPSLRSAVSSHLAIMTDERDTCRRYGPGGECEKSDFVFDLSEQLNPRVLADGRVRGDRVAAGHVEIVGESGVRPHKLVEALQRNGVLAATPPEKREALERLLARRF